MRNQILFSFFLIYSVSSHALPSGKLTIEEECYVPPGSSNICDTHISWVKSETHMACLWFVGPTTKLARCSNDNSVLYTWQWTQRFGQTFELRAHDDWPTRSPQWPDDMEQQRESAPLLDVVVLKAYSRYAGGSNHAWYYLEDNTAPFACDREPYGILRNYHSFVPDREKFSNNLIPIRGHSVRNVVIDQLNAMAASGQRSIRVPIAHRRDLSDGTNIKANSTTPLPTQYLINVENFVKDIADAGFEFVVIGFFPIGQSSPDSWPEEFGYTFESAREVPWDRHPEWQQRTNENFEVIQQVREAVYQSISANNLNIDVVFDLRNESSAFATWSIRDQAYYPWLGRYNNEIWNKYLQASVDENHPYGNTADTVGFSFNFAKPAVPHIELMIDYIDTQYINSMGISLVPKQLQVHIYSGPDERLNELALNLDPKAVQLGEKLPVYIGEAYYNDGNSAAAFSASVTSNNLDFTSLIQWPLDLDGGVCNDTSSGINVIPLDFNVYRDAGF